MNEIITLILLSVGLAMDAFAVAVSDSAAYLLNRKQKISIAVCFGVMQGAMPLIGYFLGTTFVNYIAGFDHYIALGLLTFLGGKMIVDSIGEIKKHNKDSSSKADNAIDNLSVIQSENNDTPSKPFTLKLLIIQGVATSIDALAVGLTIALSFTISVWICVSAIAIITFALCLLGVAIGAKLGVKSKDKAGIIGGIILIGIGLKIFLEHILG
ncbi:MAG: manganese efflux pump MntP family protein [Clostridia bacterium]